MDLSVAVVNDVNDVNPSSYSPTSSSAVAASLLRKRRRNHSLLWSCCFLAVTSPSAHVSTAFVAEHHTTQNALFATRRYFGKNSHNNNNTPTTATTSTATATATSMTRCSRDIAMGQQSAQNSVAFSTETEKSQQVTGSPGSTTATTTQDDSQQQQQQQQQHQHIWIWEGDNEEDNNNDDNTKSTNGNNSNNPELFFGGHWKHPPEKPSMIGCGGTAVVGSTDEAEAIEAVTARVITSWCEDFVSALDLCPWARASLQTRGAMRFFLVPPSPEASSIDWNSMALSDAKMLLEETERERMRNIVENAAERFQTEILTTTNDDESSEGDRPSDNSTNSPGGEASVLEKAAIYFVVFLPNRVILGEDVTTNGDDESPPPRSLLSDSFVDFIDWFAELEDDWPEEFDDVIVAPFHPSWEFGVGDDNDDACLDYEKRSPYPLVTLVSTGVVEKAGIVVTEAIGEHNKQVLLGIEKQAAAKQPQPTPQQQQHHQQQYQSKGVVPTTTTDEPSKERTTAASASAKKKSRVNASVAELWRAAVYGNTMP